jgi:hypothetical protein
MTIKSFAAAVVGDAASARNIFTNILQASTEQSITGKSLDGTIVRRLFPRNSQFIMSLTWRFLHATDAPRPSRCLTSCSIKGKICLLIPTPA